MFSTKVTNTVFSQQYTKFRYILDDMIVISSMEQYLLFATKKLIRNAKKTVYSLFSMQLLLNMISNLIVYESLKYCIQIIMNQLKCSLIFNIFVLHFGSFQLKQHGHRHILNIPQLDKNDFGNYTCRATNTLGEDQAILEISGTFYRYIMIRIERIKRNKI